MPQRTQRSQRRVLDCRLRIADCGSNRGLNLCVLGVLCGYFFYCLNGIALATTQEVVPLDGTAFQGDLVGIDANGAVFFRLTETKGQRGEMRSLPLERLVRWGNPVAPRPQTIVVLADGGQIVTAADWAGGAAVRVVGDEVVVLSELWNERHLKRELVSGIVFAQQSRSEDRERLVERVKSEPSPAPSLKGRGNLGSDIVLLSNGDRLSGSLREIERGSLAIETKNGEVKVPLSRVEAVGFTVADKAASSFRQGETEGRRSGYVVGLRDGSLLYAKAIRADEKEIVVELARGVKLNGGTVGDLIALQSLGGQFVYLSDLDGADYRIVPYLTIAWPYTRDRNVLGGPLVVRGKRYLKGIGMHSAARLTYRFDGDYQRFDSAIAIDDSAKGRGSVTFAAYDSRDGKWSEAYKSNIVRGGQAPVPISVDLRGARGLTLTVDFADRGDELDHAVWLDARLVR
jgi:hypothetical protein